MSRARIEQVTLKGSRKGRRPVAPAFAARRAALAKAPAATQSAPETPRLRRKESEVNGTAKKGLKAALTAAALAALAWGAQARAQGWQDMIVSVGQIMAANPDLARAALRAANDWPQTAPEESSSSPSGSAAGAGAPGARASSATWPASRSR
jgi:hypothetical protein